LIFDLTFFLLKSIEALAVQVPRMTTRRWMIAVSAIGIILKLQRDLRALITARREALSQRSYLNLAKLAEHTYCLHDDEQPTTPQEILRRKKQRYYYQLIMKYDYASRHPWLPVAPDPPEPK
jgi:hypothetical protein